MDSEFILQCSACPNKTVYSTAVWFNCGKLPGIPLQTGQHKELAGAPNWFLQLQNIFDCLEGNTAPVPCVRNNEPCSRQDYCAAHKLWKKLDEHMHSYLDSASLADAMPLGVMVDGIPSMRETANT